MSLSMGRRAFLKTLAAGVAAAAYPKALLAAGQSASYTAPLPGGWVLEFSQSLRAGPAFATQYYMVARNPAVAYELEWANLSQEDTPEARRRNFELGRKAVIRGIQQEAQR